MSKFGLGFMACKKLRDAAALIEAAQEMNAVATIKEETRATLACVKDAACKRAKKFLDQHDGVSLLISTTCACAHAGASVAKLTARAMFKVLNAAYQYVQVHDAPARHPFIIAMGL